MNVLSFEKHLLYFIVIVSFFFRSLVALIDIDKQVLVYIFLSMVPFLFYRVLKEFSLDLKLLKLDLYIAILAALFFLSIVNSLFYTSFEYSAHLIISFVSSIIIYCYARFIGWNRVDMLRLSLVLLVLIGSYTILEFFLYYLDPAFISYVQNYKLELQGVKYFNVPEHDYIFSQSVKPFGVLMEASASGVLIVILLTVSLVLKRDVNTKIFDLSFLIGLLGVFFSGSKTAYFVLIIFFLLYFLHYKKQIKTSVLLVLQVLFLLSIVFFISYFFVDNRFDNYFSKMIIAPIQEIYIFFSNNMLDMIIGIGEVNREKMEVIYLTEIDIINTVIRHGIIFSSVFIFILYNTVRANRDNWIIVLVLILSMVHYSVVFKFPVLIFVLLFVASHSRFNTSL